MNYSHAQPKSDEVHGPDTKALKRTASATVFDHRIPAERIGTEDGGPASLGIQKDVMEASAPWRELDWIKEAQRV